jgi:uncharacterized protein (TIGR03086 family)
MRSFFTGDEDGKTSAADVRSRYAAAMASSGLIRFPYRMATIEQLADALNRTGRLVAGIHDDQWGNPTPCSEWDVRALVNHVVNGTTAAASAFGAETHRTAEYDEAASMLLAVFRQPGALDRIVTIPFGTVPGAVALHIRLTELLVHGWDIAQATGQRTDFPEELAEEELAFSKAAMDSVPPGSSSFAAPQPAPEDAPALDRLVALLGREVK